MSTTHLSACPVCNSQNFSPFISCEDYTVSHETYTIVQCEACSFKFTQDIPDEQSIGRYYQSESYVSHSGSKKGIINWLYHQVRARSLKKKYKLASAFIKGVKIIDYGCGTGEFLNTCQAKGWTVQGYEPSDDARNFAINHNHIPVSSPPELANYPDGGADIVTLWHVLEHVHTLKETIELLLTKIKSGGTLLIAVPNCSSFDAAHYGKFWAAYDVPRHLYHFEPKTMNELMHHFNLKLRLIKPMIFDSFYVSMLSEKYLNGGTMNPWILVKAFWIGLRSNMKASKTKLTYSSQIYIFQKP